jgi:hypothetical protein
MPKNVFRKLAITKLHSHLIPEIPSKPNDNEEQGYHLAVAFESRTTSMILLPDDRKQRRQTTNVCQNSK